MVDELRNGSRVESALTYAVSAGAGVNILAIGLVMSLINPLPYLLPLLHGLGRLSWSASPPW
jgi:hypothetical protein